MQEYLDEEHIQGEVVAAGIQPRSKQFAVSGPAAQFPALPRRIRLLTNLALVALLGVILLTLSLWLGGVRLPGFTSIPNQPSLTLSNGPYHIGSAITLRGEHFSRYAIIVLLLDGQPAVDSNGLRLAVDSDDQGMFVTTLTITPNWNLGRHILGAKDTASSQQALIMLMIEQPSG